MSPSEPEIVINGRRLSEGQAMTVRVALNSFLMELEEPDALGSDKHGRVMAAAYKDRIREVLVLMFSRVE